MLADETLSSYRVPQIASNISMFVSKTNSEELNSEANLFREMISDGAYILNRMELTADNFFGRLNHIHYELYLGYRGYLFTFATNFIDQQVGIDLAQSFKTMYIKSVETPTGVLTDRTGINLDGNKIYLSKVDNTKLNRFDLSAGDFNPEGNKVLVITTETLISKVH